MNEKKSILFVDDEVMVLQGLKRILRLMRDKWDCEFAESGRQALTLMDTRHFDVVVSDMMMPSMNGAELLSQVRDMHPQTVRFILSGHANPELIRKCTSCTHRFLNKPCDFDALNVALDRATAIAFSLQNLEVAALVTKIDRLPSPHAVCLELERRMNSPNYSLEEIGAVIGRDVSMTAQVLKLVNSAFFGLPRQIDTPHEAVSFLGVDTIRSLALCLNLNKQMEDFGISTVFIDQLWRHSLRVQAGARRIAEMENAPESICKESATAGLLHDTGKLIMALNFPALMQQANELAHQDHLTLTAAERTVFKCTHAAVGGYLFSLWGLSLPVVRAVAWHHTPQLDEAPAFSATTAVYAADLLTHELSNECEGGIPEAFDSDYLAARGLTERIPAWREQLAALP